jgi:calpain-15
MEEVINHFKEIAYIPDVQGIIEKSLFIFDSKRAIYNKSNDKGISIFDKKKPSQFHDEEGKFVWESSHKKTNLMKPTLVRHPTLDSDDNKFIDRTFFPWVNSLFDESLNKFKKEIRESKIAEIEWKRIQHAYHKNNITIAWKVKQGDVCQGQIGDWYFMAVISALAAMHPEIISDMFLTKNFNEAGIYSMMVYVNGHRQKIVVDDYIPYDRSSRSPSFAGKATANIWPILLEKAWAKVWGSYEGIISGAGSEAIKFLLPYEIEHEKYEFKKVDVDKFWEKIFSSIKAKHLVICSSHAEDNDADLEPEEVEIGLLVRHCYAITGAYYHEVGGNKLRLLKVLNPWNSHRYTGPWHDGYIYWNAKIKEAVDFDKKSSGEFYIRISTFMKYFRSFTFWKIDKSLMTKTIKLKHKAGSYWMAKIHLQEPSQLVLKVDQMIERAFPKNVGYKLSYSRILVGRETNDPSKPYEYVTGGFSENAEESFVVKTNESVQKGTYVVYLEIDWETKEISTFSFSVIAKKFDLMKINPAFYKEFLVHCITDYARKLPIEW